MKYSKNNKYQFWALSYTKLLCFKTILMLLIVSCGVKSESVQAQEEIKNKPNFYDSIPPSLLSSAPKKDLEAVADKKVPAIIVGAARLNLYLDSLKGKRIGIVGNQSSMIENTHLVDTLLALGFDVIKVFSPEHGFRGDADAGEKISNSKDPKTGLQIISLYGKNKRPHPEQLVDLDVLIYDIQDVGVRFYTYISTLHYVMEACAMNKKPLIILDRPNPNGHYVDGPMLEEAQKSFVGMHPVPVVYGMTIGEYAQMINGENWLERDRKCEIQVVPCLNYTHASKYKLPIDPSPNLRTATSIALYPSLCLFEATTISVGRGTKHPFEVFGHPKFPVTDYHFTPVSSYGAKEPKWQDKVCNGFNLQQITADSVFEMNLSWLIAAEKLIGKNEFIDHPKFFDRLAGTSKLRTQLLAHKTEEEIRASWQADLTAFKVTRAKYLLYK